MKKPSIFFWPSGVFKSVALARPNLLFLFLTYLPYHHPPTLIRIPSATLPTSLPRMPRQRQPCDFSAQFEQAYSYACMYGPAAGSPGIHK